MIRSSDIQVLRVNTVCFVDALLYEGHPKNNANYHFIP